MSGRKKVSFEDWEEEQENVSERINCIDQSVQNVNDTSHKEEHTTINNLIGLLKQPRGYEQEKKNELAYVSQKKTYKNAVTGIKSNYGGDIKAIQDFKALISQGYAVADCCYKLGHYYTYSVNNFSYTDAKMYLEKANQLNSNDSKILETLKFCETKNEAKILEALKFCEAKKERAHLILGLTAFFILIATILFCYLYWSKFGWWSLLSIPIDIIILVILWPLDDKKAKETIILDETH